MKTVLLDRRRGEEGRRSRLRGVRSLLKLAAAGEQIWVFFEGRRARNPDQISSARQGIGWMVEGLQARGISPVVFAIHHRGLEHVIPMSSRRCITLGNRIDIRWSECDLKIDQARGATPPDAQQIADDIRAAVVRLQSHWRSEESMDA